MDRMLMSAEVRPSLSKGSNRMRQEDRCRKPWYTAGEKIHRLWSWMASSSGKVLPPGNNVLIELQIKGKGGQNQARDGHV